MLKKISTILVVLALLPALALAAELNGTIVKVNNAEKQIVVRTEKGEQTLQFTSSTKGVENAKEGAKVTVKYSEKDGQPRVSEIIAGERSPAVKSQ